MAAAEKIYNTNSYIFQGLIGAAIGGLVFALVISAFLKKYRPRQSADN
ncbi:MAG TPA: hypothetical protein VGB30_12760 [bacterium]|jgi:hypoxanthine phosphoribosyltransferase